MSQTLRDFIAGRESEIKAQIKALNDELRELRTAKSAIDGSGAVSTDRVTSSRMTHREMIVAVLDERPDGGTSDKVIEWVNEKFSVDISQASMSSQLSRAKSDGVVNLDTSTKTWRSRKHVDGGHRLPMPPPVPLPAPPSGYSGSAEPEKAKTESAGGTFGFQNPNQMPRGQ